MVMEPLVAQAQPFRLDPAHPNSIRWQRAIDDSELRGQLVCEIMERAFADEKKTGVSTLHEKHILDIGCGIGGTSIALSRCGARVVAVDSHPQRLRTLNERNPHIATKLADGTALPFDNEVFDGVVLQDVIEHVDTPALLLREAARVLRTDGILYISTPNRFALTNILADPHWGLPFASLMKRATLRRYLALFRPNDKRRNDLAQLLSLRRLIVMLQESGFAAALHQRFVVETLFEHPRRIVWSDFHLRIVDWLRRLRLHHVLLARTNDRAGMLNRVLAPTWYLTCRKIPS